MRLVMAALLLSAQITPAVAQEAKPKFPYGVDSWVVNSGWGVDVLQLTVTSTAFDMNIASITLNRGNCEVLENKVVDGRFVLPTYPQTLKFGLKKVFWTQANCVPLEMVISTVEGGKFTLTFKSN
ncbi:hypothetical protein [Ensifer sp. B1-9]|uniref:hypothetical protein n=1 Tax=Ensifer sp. B1-9 TaxID=3141455 RepID=UPI003D22B40A